VQEDLALIEMILGGSTVHWHAFVDRYAGLIYSVVRRQLFVEDDDEGAPSSPTFWNHSIAASWPSSAAVLSSRPG
jgi:hypothetical protein